MNPGGNSTCCLLTPQDCCKTARFSHSYASLPTPRSGPARLQPAGL